MVISKAALGNAKGVEVCSPKEQLTRAMQANCAVSSSKRDNANHLPSRCQRGLPAQMATSFDAMMADATALQASSCLVRVVSVAAATGASLSS